MLSFENIYFHIRKNQRKTQLIKICTKGRVKKKKPNRITHKTQNEKGEGSQNVFLCPKPAHNLLKLYSYTSYVLAGGIESDYIIFLWYSHDNYGNGYALYIQEQY